jgi:RNA polymerase sigma-70 factor (ECF subfamily)
MEALMEAHEPILISKAQGGDRAAFEELLSRHRKPLEYLVRSRSAGLQCHAADADDILQEAALRAFQSLDRFQWRGDDSFFRWLAGIALHVLADAARRDARHPQVALDRDHPRDDPSPSHALCRQERLERLEAALEGLTPEHRAVVRLARIEGLRVSEIAQRLNRSPSAVRHLLLRALEKLKERFGETDSLHLPPEGFAPEEAEG